MSSEPTYTTPADAAYDALLATSLGRHEQDHGQMRVIADITIDQVIEAVVDLAVADRVAFVLARRTGRTFAVIAQPHSYVVVSVVQALPQVQPHEIVQAPHQPRLLSIATPTGITPMLADTAN